MLTTIVTGQIDWQILDQLTTLWLTLHNHAHADGHAPRDGDGHASHGDEHAARRPGPRRQPSQ